MNWAVGFKVLAGLGAVVLLLPSSEARMIGNLPFVACMVLIALGFWTLLFKRNLVKLVIGVGLIESGVNLFLVALGYVRGGVPPIYTYAPAGAPMVLPTPRPSPSRAS